MHGRTRRRALPGPARGSRVDIRARSSVHDIAPAAWQALAGSTDPFAAHAFHTALEDSGSVGPGSGWTPHHLVAEESGKVVGILPLFLKDDSFGEFVFDWAWAEAFHRHGLHYYPKLVAATPFSPVGAPRLLLDPAHDAAHLRAAFADAALAERARLDCSTLHWLFIDADLATTLNACGHILRHDCQFHWHNDGYREFADFLERFRSHKRKDVKRERGRVSESGLRIERRTGSTIDGALWSCLHALTATSFRIRGGEPYFNEACFRLLGERLGDAMVAVIAWEGETPVACALLVQGPDVLYGRYWGTTVDVPGLHFELCYYQGIEHCIEHGLARYEPGAQGEHKLARGFEPVRTTSAHWIADPRFRQPIADWCERERAFVDQYIRDVRTHLPFHREAHAG